jgi:hypothetical protein
MALIPVLGLVLLFVLWPSSSEPSTDSAATAVAPEATASSATTSAPVQEAASGPATSSSNQPKKWPVIELATILQHDPFAQLAALSETAVAGTPPSQPGGEQPSTEAETAASQELQKRLLDRLAGLKQKHVSALFVSQRGASALIDSKVVREGDLLEEGIRVVAIGTDGVVLRIEGD